MTMVRRTQSRGEFCPECGPRIRAKGGFEEKPETGNAIAWMAEDCSRTQYQAAKKFHIQESTLSRARRRDAAKVICGTCGKRVPPPPENESDEDLI